MNKIEFVDEVKSSSLCPKEFEEIYVDFQRFQKLVWNTLNAFHDICENNGVRYQLAFGSLLGAIRDGGQIPWDSDADVFVPAEDRKKLVDALERDLNSSFYYECAENNKKCRNEMIRICPKGYRTEVLHVDVFFLVGTPENEEEFKKYTERIRFLCNARFEKLVKIKEEFYGRPKAIILHSLRRIRYAPYSVSKLHEKYILLCSKFSVFKTSKSVNANGFAGKYYIPSELIRETILLKIGDTEYRVPKHYKELLTLLFKDYMTVPCLERRLKEMLSSYAKLKRYEKLAKESPRD